MSVHKRLILNLSLGPIILMIGQSDRCATGAAEVREALVVDDAS